jgi:hypothetical protein
MAEAGASSSIAAAQPAPMPLFYRRPVALSPARHIATSILGVNDYRFARQSNSIPLSLTEFSLAVRHYPIVFAGTAPPVPVAIVGIDAADNLFVDEDGHWLDGAYVPAYVRRYPFVFIEDAARQEFILGIDEAAPALGEFGENRLFRDGKPTVLVDRALSFCREYQANVNATREFCAALEAESLLSEKTAEFALKNGRKVRLTGFRVIEEARFDKLPGKEFLALRRRGWLHPIYLHLVATANWATLIDLAAQRPYAGPVPPAGEGGR